jgi:DNA-binding transcriptional ArsR family regulator
LSGDSAGRVSPPFSAGKGNPLTLEDVRALEEGATVFAPARARREVRNYFAALRQVEKQAAKKRLAGLPEEERAEVLAALAAIPSAFGRPHLQGGLGICQLRRGVFEARVGLSRRAIFVRLGDTLRVQLIGDHDEVQRYLRGL